MSSREHEPWFEARGFKLDPGHSDRCFLAELGRQEFIVHDGADFRRDRIGRKRPSGGTMWHRFKCNDPDCDARLLVRYDQIMHFAADALAEAANSQAKAE